VQVEVAAAPGVWAWAGETTPAAHPMAAGPRSVTATGLFPGQSYRFRAKAVRLPPGNHAGTPLSSAWSPPSLPMATPPRRPPPPPPPTVKALAVNHVDLAWAPDPR
jgi:hypothetical protein